VGRLNTPLSYRTKPWLLAALYIVGLVVSTTLGNGIVHAQELTNRSISVTSGLPSVVNSHTFQFNVNSVSNVGSIVFEYCENTPVFGQVCDAPLGLDVSSANLASQIGNTGFSIDNGSTTANKLVLTRPAVPGLAVTSSYNFNNITNPANAPNSEFIRISTYASTNGTGGFTDNGAVAFAINSPLNVAAYIPPFLNFCVGVTVAVDCSSTVGDSIDLGVISTSAVNSATSQFSTATNDGTGYVVSVLGNTMTSGNNVIPALPAPFPSLVGTSAFGFNLRANSNPAKGQNPFGVGTGVPSTNYNFPNFFMFSDGDVIASSSLSSDYTRMTSTYMINASNSQPPGVYSATLTYVATVQF
jgi:hypothetical protein